MKGIFIKKGGAFYPSDDDTYERFRKIKEYRPIELEFKQSRNLELHRKYFALINTAWAYLTEEQERLYGSIEAFRKAVTIGAGFYEPLLDLQEGRFVKSPKSIAFDKMSEEEFENLYESTKNVLFTYILKDISVEEFMSNLNDF